MNELTKTLREMLDHNASEGTIYRHRVITEEIKIPKEDVSCPICKGAGMMSKYDEGWTSFIHDPELAAKRTCWRCAGLGHVPAEEA